MIRKRLAGIAVLLAAAGLIVWRTTRAPIAPPQHFSQQPGRPARVVLFADLQEADEIPGCGQIIKAVRDAARRGIATRELDARHDAETARGYKLLVAPSVIIFDTTGKESRRFEGESADTIAAITRAVEGVRN